MFFFIKDCVQVETVKVPKPKTDLTVICFWDIGNFTIQDLTEKAKGDYLTKFIPNCDMISLIGIHPSQTELVSKLEEKLMKIDSSYKCAEGEPKGSMDSREEKYITCVKKTDDAEIIPIEFQDKDNRFITPPTLFLVQYNSLRYLITPFHSTPKNKQEIRSFKHVVNFAYQNYSDRRAFFGGNFNAGTNHLPEDFLTSLDYFVILKQLVPDASTFENQKDDLIFTDPRLGRKCKGKVWQLAKLYPELKAGEEISTHFPVSIECKQ